MKQNWKTSNLWSVWVSLCCLSMVLMSWVPLQVWAVEIPKDILQKMQAPNDEPQTVNSDLDRLRNQDSRNRSSVTVPTGVPDESATSPLESDFSQRANVPLTQFGYDVFRTGKGQETPVAGAAPDSYVLGVGDELIITMRGGKENRTSVVRVDMEGRVMVPSLIEPMMVVGTTFGAFRDELKEKVRTTQVGTEVYVSIGTFRFFSVYVMGEVAKPGQHRVTGLSSLLDALAAAGGVRKTGSSRAIQIHRDGKVLSVDLYALLNRGQGGVDPTLTVGDRIVVPPLGPVVAVTGLVKRPGIYELPADHSSILLRDLLTMAGGLVNPTGNRIAIRSPDAKDRETLSELNLGKNPKVMMGAIVMVEAKSGSSLMGDVTLTGHVIRPQTRSLASSRTVHQLLSDTEQIKPDPYLPFGVIYRIDAKTRNRNFVPIDLGMILKREELDLPLLNHDTLIVLGMEDIRFLSYAHALAVQNKPMPGNQCAGFSRLGAMASSSSFLQFSKLVQMQNGGGISTSGGQDAKPSIPGIATPVPFDSTGKGSTGAMNKALTTTQLPPALSLTETVTLPEPSRPGLKMDSRLQTALPLGSHTPTTPPAAGACPEVFNQFPDLLGFLLENSVLLEGNTDQPSLFPILAGARLTDIIPVAQGFVGAAKLDKFASLHFQIDRKFGSPDSTREIVDLSKKDFSSFAIQPGDLLRFKFGQVQMVGHITTPQERTLQSVPTVRHFLLDTDILKPDPYLLFGVLRRVDPVSHNQILAAVNLDAILKGETTSDTQLRDRDMLVILGIQEIAFLANPLVQSILLGKPPRIACQSLRHLSELMSSSDAFRFSNAIHLSMTEFEQDKSAAKRMTDKSSTMITVEGAGFQKNECPAIFEQYPEILPYLLENVTIMTGEIRSPGVYPIVSGTRLSSMVQSGGGLTSRADMRQVELSRGTVKPEQGRSLTTRSILDFTSKNFDDFQLKSGDVLRFSPIFSDREIGYVRLEGEFMRPGLYDIRREDKLSDIINRAGGLTAHAYPYGAVFTRSSIQKSQKESFLRVAQELEMSLANLMMTSDKDRTNTAGVMESARGIIASLRSVEPMGRMVVETNPKILKEKPDQDVILVAGDRLFMPKRPSEVSVSGAVLNPGSFLYVNNQSPQEYIKWAGGFKDIANKNETFIVMPDGKAQAMWSLANWWDQQAGVLMPGSTIVVPLDPKPFEFMSSIKDVTQVLSQWAITIASLSVLSR